MDLLVSIVVVIFMSFLYTVFPILPLGIFHQHYVMVKSEKKPNVILILFFIASVVSLYVQAQGMLKVFVYEKIGINIFVSYVLSFIYTCVITFFSYRLVSFINVKYLKKQNRVQ